MPDDTRTHTPLTSTPTLHQSSCTSMSLTDVGRAARRQPTRPVKTYIGLTRRLDTRCFSSGVETPRYT